MHCPPYSLLVVRLDTGGPQPPPIPVPEGFRCERLGAGDLVASEEVEPLLRCDCVLVDARGSKGQEGAAALHDLVLRIGRCDGGCPVLVMVDDDDLALAAASAGAWDVLLADAPKPPADRLAAAALLRRLRCRATPALGTRSDVDGPASATAADDSLAMVGTSEPIRGVFQLIRRAAPFDVPVLLTGESGTGKELAALAIHERSQRAEKPFIPINCGAIPESLLESELFGYEKGAFTGATQARKGRFETADGGTLFLDEVGELTPPLQVKLLRFLENHVVEHVGGRAGIPLDVRVIAATNRELQSMVRDGTFREDLFFRLAVLTIDLPPLRERGDDILLLARYFLERYGKQSGKTLGGFSRDAIGALLEHPWPGNVRELINRVRRAVVVCEGSLVDAADLDLAPPGRVARVTTLREARRRAERECLRAALQRTRGNRKEAARLLGISRTQLYEMLARHRVPDSEHATT